MRMLAIAVLMSCAGIASSTCAQTADDRRQAVMSMAAMASVAAKNCSLTIDTAALTDVLAKGGLSQSSLTSGANKSDYNDLVEGLQDTATEHKAQFCQMANASIGPSGSSGIHLLKSK